LVSGRLSVDSACPKAYTDFFYLFSFQLERDGELDIAPPAPSAPKRRSKYVDVDVDLLDDTPALLRRPRRERKPAKKFDPTAVDGTGSDDDGDGGDDDADSDGSGGDSGSGVPDDDEDEFNSEESDVPSASDSEFIG
jgi:hypothetical protein